MLFLSSSYYLYTVIQITHKKYAQLLVFVTCFIFHDMRYNCTQISLAKRMLAYTHLQKRLLSLNKYCIGKNLQGLLIKFTYLYILIILTRLSVISTSGYQISDDLSFSKTSMHIEKI